jgi:hypothetical protein
MPTSRLGSFGGVKPSSASDRAVGPILAAQPQVRARRVSVFFLTKFIIIPFAVLFYVSVSFIDYSYDLENINRINLLIVSG